VQQKRTVIFQFFHAKKTQKHGKKGKMTANGTEKKEEEL
jgi:hypothetical protein